MARLTIPDEQTFATFTVVTSTSAFPITFSLFAKADLTVKVDGVALEQSAFSFSGTLLEGGGYDGGTVTLNDAVDDVAVRIERNVAPARTSNFAPASTTPVGTVDQALNRLTAVQQDHARRVGGLEDIVDDAVSAVADPALAAVAAAQAVATAAISEAQGVSVTAVEDEGAARLSAIGAAGDDEIAQIGTAGDTEIAAVAAEGAAQVANVAQVFGAKDHPDNTKALSNGVASVAISAAGTGGTPGTYAWTTTGGAGSNASGYLTVNGSGVISAVVVEERGHSYTSAPTIVIAGSHGVTGHTLTPAIAINRPVGTFWRVKITDGWEVFENVGGVATSRGAYSDKALIDAVKAYGDDLQAYITEVVPSVNMYDPATMKVVGFYVTSGNAIAPEASWNYAKIPVSPGDVVSWKTNTERRTGSTWLDSGGTPVSGQYAATAGVAGTSYSRTAPAGAAFLALNIKSNTIAEPTEIMVNLGDTALTYQAYEPTLALNTDALPEGLRTLRDELDADVLTTIPPVNLYNPADKVAGSYITGTGSVNPDAAWGMVFIDVTGLTDICINANTTRRAGSAFYTAKNTGGYMSGTYSSSDARPQVRDVPDGALWLGVNLYSNTITEPTEFMVSATAGPVDYEAWEAPRMGIRADAVTGGAAEVAVGAVLVLNGLTGTAYIETERAGHTIRRGIDPFPNGASVSKKAFNFVSDAVDDLVLRTMDDDVAPVRLIGPGTVGANHDYVVNRTIRCIVDGVEIAARTGSFAYSHRAAFLETYDVDTGSGVLFSTNNAYVFDADGQCTIYTDFVARASITLQDIMFLQAVVSLAGVDGDVDYYIPQTLPVTHEGTDRNYALIDTSDTTGWTTGLLFTPARCEPTGLQPDRIVMLTDTYGFATGYLEVQSADPAVRAALTTSKRGEVRQTKKWYPSAVDKGSTALTAGDTFSVIGYRNLIVRDAARTCFYPVRAQAFDFLYADWHDTDLVDTLPIPTDYLGREFEVVHSRGVTVLSETLTPGLLVDVASAGDYATLILKVAK